MTQKSLCIYLDNYFSGLNKKMFCIYLTNMNFLYSQTVFEEHYMSCIEADSAYLIE